MTKKILCWSFPFHFMYFLFCLPFFRYWKKFSNWLLLLLGHFFYYIIPHYKWHISPFGNSFIWKLMDHCIWHVLLAKQSIRHWYFFFSFCFLTLHSLCFMESVSRALLIFSSYLLRVRERKVGSGRRLTAPALTA